LAPLARQYVKLCDARDFADEEFLDVVRSVIPERDPLQYVERKVWEFATLVLFMSEAGLLEERTHALSVGAGDERILFWLANRIGRVVATDIYGSGRFAANEARHSMLTDPGSHAPYPYREDRLEVLWMDARKLEFPDESFDLVFTISSIEHFGSRRDIARAAQEIGRVLKPGGYAVIVTDCLVRLHPLDATPAGFAVRTATRGRRSAGARPFRRGMLGEVFTPRELRSQIVRPSGLELVQPLDARLSAETWGTMASDSRGARAGPGLLVRVGRSYFTSVCVVLTKLDTGDPPRSR
jgi:SAM-dependent methyltransferase